MATTLDPIDIRLDAKGRYGEKTIQTEFEAARSVLKLLLQHCRITTGYFRLRPEKQVTWRLQGIPAAKAVRVQGQAVTLRIKVNSGNVAWDYVCVLPGSVDAGILFEQLYNRLNTAGYQVTQLKDELEKPKALPAPQPVAAIPAPPPEPTTPANPAPPPEPTAPVASPPENGATTTGGSWLDGPEAILSHMTAWTEALQRSRARHTRLEQLDKQRVELETEIADIKKQLEHVSAETLAVMEAEEEDKEVAEAKQFFALLEKAMPLRK